MNPACINHPAEPAAGVCSACACAFCEGCLVELLGRRMCGPCRDTHLAQMQNRPENFEQMMELAAKRVSVEHRNEYAQGAFYLGLASLLPCGGQFIGVAAVILGILGLRACLKDPDVPGRAYSIAGIVLGAGSSILYWSLFVIGEVLD